MNRLLKTNRAAYCVYLLFFVLASATWACAEELAADAPLTLEEVQQNQLQFRVPRDAFSVSANSAQGGAGAEMAFDGNPDTIWHSRWNQPGNYPFYLEVEFKQDEEIDRIHYLTRQQGDNGNIHQYTVQALQDGTWQPILQGGLPGSRGMYVLRFPTVKARKLRLEVTGGEGGFASAAEVEFYRPDVEAGNVRKILQELTFSGISADKKREIREKLGEIKKETKRREIFAEVELAQRFLDASESLAPRSVAVVQKPSVQTELSWRRGGFAWSYFQPTGMYVTKNCPMAVFVEAEGAIPVMIIGNFRTRAWDDQARLPLRAGWNFMLAPKDGILYIDNPHEAPAQSANPAIHILNATPMPFYEYGKTTPQQWKEMLAGPNPSGMAEILTGRALITASAENAAKHVDDPDALCASYNHLMDTYARLMGFSEDAAPPHRRPKNLIHLFEVDHMYMYATSFRTAYHFHHMKPVLNNQTFRRDGWGPWHEIGHIHQVQQYKFKNLTEVTVNIFSLEMQASLGQKARIDTPNYRRQLARYFETPERDYHKMEDVFLKLCMFWQLRMAFGEEFYPRLHQIYRETELPTGSDAEKVQTFIRISSEVAGYDLSPFYLAWGLNPSEETLAEIKKWKKLETPIWENMEFSTVTPAGTMGISTER